MSDLRIIPLHLDGEVEAGADLCALASRAAENKEPLQDHDVLIITSKVVSKAEGRVVPFDGTEAHKQQLIEDESTRILRRRGPMRITETSHGFVNANAGIDLSNTKEGTAVLLPIDPDKTAWRIKAEFLHRFNLTVAVIVTDTFGRAWRNGVTDIALGCAGISPIHDLRGTTDAGGRVLEVTEVAIVDELAGAANLVLHKDAGTPFAIIRGLDPRYFGEGSVREHIVRPASNDLFR